MAELLIFILFMLFAALSRFLESRRARETAEGGQPTETSTAPRPRRPHWADDDAPVAAEEDSLSEALRQIREALGQPTPEPEPAKEPLPRPSRAAQESAPTPAPEVVERLKDHGGTSTLRETAKPLEVERVRGLQKVSAVGRELQNPAAVRRAVIMKEILDAPPSRQYRSVRRY